MYVFKSKLEGNIWYNPIFIGSKIIANTKDRKVRVFDSETFEIVDELEYSNISNIREVNNNKIFLSDSEKSFIYNIENKKQIEEANEGIDIYRACISGNFLYTRLSYEERNAFVKYDYKKREVLKEYDFSLGRSVFQIQDKLIFDESSVFVKRLFCIDEATGELIWEVNVIDLFEDNNSGSHKIGGARILNHEENIFFSVSGKYFCLDAMSGKVKWRKDGINYLVNLYKETLIHVDGESYHEICAKTGEILKQFDMTEEYKRHDFRLGVSNFTITDNYIFIAYTIGYILGAINRVSGIIEWSTNVGDGKVTLPNSPIVYKNNLYVLDDEGTLHHYAPKLTNCM